MFTEPGLYLQQCRIFQNKDKEPVVVYYTHDSPFYRKLDALVQNGQKVKVVFENEKLAQDSHLFARIASCFNGGTILDNPDNFRKIMEPVLDVAGKEELIGLLTAGQEMTIRLYQAYLVSYSETTGTGAPFILFKPAGEGIPSYSFEVEI